MERRVSLTSHAAVLLMPTQNFIRQLMDTLDTACEPAGEFTMRAAKFQSIFIENNLDSRDTITEALEGYESFHVLEALPTRWSPIHRFKCNCRSCFTHALFHTHVLLASMVCDPKIEIPLQYVTATFQIRGKRGRPARSGEQGKGGDAEEEARKKVHGKGYEVPSVVHMETVDSDQDFEEPPPPSRYMLISCRC